MPDLHGDAGRYPLPRRALSARRVAATVALCAILVAITASTSQSSEASAATKPAADRAVSIATLGDSITISFDTDTRAEPAASQSWVPYAVGNRITWSAGYAHSGYTTGAIAGETRRYKADVLVILAGTNDVIAGIPFAPSANNLKAMVARAKVKKVIVSAIPPLDIHPAAAAAYNVSLRKLAARQHWTYVDATSALRSGNVYATGLTEDGVHPTPAGAKLIGTALRRAILRLAGS
ncbi:hypothetical protein BH09ACT1_BH09ACT1_12120 [soil metagenome]